MSNTTVTNAMRAALKAAGFNTRQVSVKDRNYGDIKVTVRDVTVPLSVVAELVKSHENVRRDESTGETLCGGNTYVEVRYDETLVEPVAAAVAALIRSAKAGHRVQLAGGFTATRFDDQPWFEEVRAHGPGFQDHGLIARGVEHAAEQIAVKYLDQRALAAREQAAQAA